MKLKNLRYLKQFCISLIVLWTLFLLTGCGHKSSFYFDIDRFVCKFYHNDVNYQETIPDKNIEWFEIIKEFKEQVDAEYTWYINSLFVIKNIVESGLDIQDIVEVNTQQLKSKLLQYTQIEYEDDIVKCKDNQYPWYISTFSYLLWEDIIYDGQYYLFDDTTLYVLSLSSEFEKDIKRFVKSVNKIECNN